MGNRTNSGTLNHDLQRAFCTRTKYCESEVINKISTLPRRCLTGVISEISQAEAFNKFSFLSGQSTSSSIKR